MTISRFESVLRDDVCCSGSDEMPVDLECVGALSSIQLKHDCLFLDTSVFPQLRHSTEDDEDMTIASKWDSRNAIRAYFGDDVDAAPLKCEDRKLQPDRKQRVRHFRLSPGQESRARETVLGLVMD